MKKGAKKTKAQLEREAASLRRQLAAFRRSVAGRKRAEEELHESEARMRAVLDSALDAVIGMDARGTISDWNSRAEAIFGWTHAEAIGRSLAERIIPPRYREAHAKGLRRYLTTGEGPVLDRLIEITALRRDGTEFPVELSISARKVGGVPVFNAFIADITERKRAEEAVRVSEEEMRALFAAMTDVILVLDVEGRYLKIAPTNPVLLYRPPDELLGRTIHEILPKTEADEILGHIRRALKNKETITVQYRLPIEGKETWFEGTVSPLNESSVFWVARDITAAKQAVEALRESEKKQALILRSVPMVTYRARMTHPFGNTWISANTAAISGFAPHAFLDAADFWESRLHPDDRERVVNAFASIEQTGSVAVEYRWQCADGVYRWFLDRAAVVAGEQGQPGEFIGTWLDITERKRTEDRLVRSLNFYLGILDEFPAMIWRSGVDAKCDYFNKTWLSFTGRTLEQEWGDGWAESVHPDDAGRCVASYLKAFHAREPFVLEYRLRRHDGEYRHIVDHGSPFNDLEGNFAGFMGSCIDVTESKRAVEALRESEERFALAVRGSNDGLWDGHPLPGQPWHSPQTPVWWSPRVREMLGFEEQEFPNVLDSWMRLLHPEDKDRVFAALVEHIERRVPYDVEYRLRTKPGDYRWFRARGQAVWDEAGNLQRMAGSLQDITERKQTEESLLEMNVALMNAMPGISWLGLDGQYVKVNDAYSKMLGYEAGEMVGMDWKMTVSPGDLPMAIAAYQQMLSEGKAEFEGTAVRKDGGIFHKQVWLVKSVDKEGQFTGHYCCMRDITERKRVEQALSAKTELLQTLTDAITAFLENEDWREASARILRSALRQTHSQYGFLGVLVAGPALRVLAHEGMFWDPNINRQFYENAVRQYQEKGFLEFTNFENLFGRVITGRQTVIANEPGSDPRSGGLPPGHPPLHHFLGVPILRGAEVVGMIGVANRPKGYTQGDQNALAVLTQAASVLYDSYRRRLREADLEDQLRQSQKLEAIGRLAGGIAHDFNNILTPILGFTDLALHTLPQDSPSRPDLEQVLLSARRARDLIKRILTFSRRDSGRHTPLSLSHLIAESLPLLRASLPTTITLRPCIADTTALVLADTTQMQQVLMNLCSNAEFAMRDTGGILELMLDGVPVDEAFAAARPPLQAGRHLRLTVRDSGCGMAPEVLPQIFDPFFTTKGPGEGSGLGLSMVHGIVISHKGAITVASVPGQGTTFEIYLPALEGAPPEEEQPQKTVAKGEACILFVDDETAVLRAGERLLRLLGYTVTALDDSRQALEAFRAAPGQFDLVITDQTMPGLTGGALATALLQICPDLPIILCTGFSHTMTAEQAAALGIRAFMAKPYTVEDMAATIRRVLDRRAKNGTPRAG